jgi:hypothetical protein
MNDWKTAELINTAKNDCINIEWTDAYWCDGFTFRRMLDGRLTPFAAVYWNPGSQLWDVYNAADEEDETLVRRRCNHFQAINEVRKLQAELFGWEDAYGKPVVEVTQGYARREYSHTCWRLAQ